jgi:hypothetical protein
MRRIELTITFTDDDGTARCESQAVETLDAPDLAREHVVAHILFSEFKVTVGKQAVSRHNATAWGWLEFPNRLAGLERYFDIRNSQAVWLELARLVMRSEANLILAQAFKALEPPSEPRIDDQTAINDLYYVHRRKMMLLDESVHGLIKVQDLVNRLIHESLGGDLVDTSDADWERTHLTRKEVNKGLRRKLELGAISLSDFDAISRALAIPKNAPEGQIAKVYRNRLMHHTRPSVDYPMFFSDLESRAGEEAEDAQGRALKIHNMFAMPPVQYRFKEMHDAFYEYLDAVVAMLQKLREVDILRH